ncbi:MAG: endo-1,4-beta-xylanase [Chthonomonadales bacterium]
MVLPVFLGILVGATSVSAPETQKVMTEQEILAGAAERIEKYRKAGAVVRVVDRVGKPVEGAAVHVEQIRHAFLFGCNAFPLLNISDAKQEAAYEREFTALFNYATLGFYWGAYEPTPGHTNEAKLKAQAEWLKEHGVGVKGHPLVWHEVYPRWAPSDAEAARSLLERRVKSIVARFAGLIDRWDVVNEATSSTRFHNGVGSWASRDTPAGMTAEALEWAHAANPKAFLIYNDFKLDRDYLELAEGLFERKAPVDAFGLQSHMHGGEWPLTRVWEVCDTFSRLGKPLHFTEVTVLSGEHGWQRKLPWPTTPEGEARQADYVEKFYTVLFSHPAVQAITWWDFADGGWQGAPGGLVRADLSPKPAYQRLLKLVKDAWWTRADLTTDAAGRAPFRGFLGRYRVTVKTPRFTRTVEAEVRRDRPNEILVRLD